MFCMKTVYPFSNQSEITQILTDSSLIPEKLFSIGIGAVGIENSWLFSDRGALRLTILPDDCQECQL